MEGSWFVRPATRRLPLSDGQWLLVKDYPSTGEIRAHLKRSAPAGRDGVRRVDELEFGWSLVVTYLVDWSLDNPIIHLSSEDLASVLDHLDPSRFAEIKDAVTRHEAAMAAARNQKKTMNGGEPNADPTSPSPSAAGSALKPSELSTSTTTPS